MKQYPTTTSSTPYQKRLWAAVALLVGAAGAWFVVDASHRTGTPSQTKLSTASVKPAGTVMRSVQASNQTSQSEPLKTMSLAGFPLLTQADRAPSTMDQVLMPAHSPQIVSASDAVPSNEDGSVRAPTDMQAPALPRLSVVPVAAPSDIDAGGLNASATAPVYAVDASSAKQSVALNTPSVQGAEGIRAMAGTSSVVYTPAQIRQAYGFASLPAGTVANKFAYQGSGQVVVIIDAFHAPNVANDLNSFSTKFGLPTCSVVASAYKAGTALSTLVSKPKAGDGCSFQVLYVNSAGAQSATAPRVDSGWATEATMDVQWVHAIAPMAKIVLVEALSNSGNDLMNAMAFASKLGATVVSMSYGSSEFSSQVNYDGIMSTSAVWVASSGDWGTGVNWPVSSSRVLGVGGTYLSNISPRAETGWSGSGGGLSKYVSMPTWQSNVTVPGNPAATAANASKMKRGVPDVAYNASTTSGVYVYMNGAWYGMGGTSAGAPQWAAFAAIANAVRANSGKTTLSSSSIQTAIYSMAKTNNYIASFLDVVSGSNGSCVTCSSIKGYDLVTGLGTPNVATLLPALVSAQ